MTLAARSPNRPGRGRVTDPFLPKIEEWIEASKGKIRADKAHDKLGAAMVLVDPLRLPGIGRARPGSPAINDDHFPDHQMKIPGQYTPRPRSKAEAEFLAIGDGALTWLPEAAAAGTARMNTKMAQAVTWAKITDTPLTPTRRSVSRPFMAASPPVILPRS